MQLKISCGYWTISWIQDMKGAGVGRIKVVLEIIPEMSFKIDLNSRLGLREEINDDGRQFQGHTILQKKKFMWLRAYNKFKPVVGTNLVEVRDNDT